MFYIKRRKESKQPGEIPAMKFIIQRWIQYKKRFATFLQERSEQLSTAKKKIYLFFFCLLFVGSSTAIVFMALQKDNNKTGIERRSKLFTPPAVQQNFTGDSLITKKEYERIKQYKDYVLGLKKTAEGQKLFDSLLSARPKLLDSIKVFENMYLSQ